MYEMFLLKILLGIPKCECQNVLLLFFFQIDTVINMELRNRRLDAAPNLDGNIEINGEDDAEPLLNEDEVDSR